MKINTLVAWHQILTPPSVIQMVVYPLHDTHKHICPILQSTSLATAALQQVHLQIGLLHLQTAVC